MAEIPAVKIPPYNLSDPQLWFSTCERTFALGVPKAITDTCTKFKYIVSNLPPEATAISEEIILAREIIPEIDHFPVPGNLGFIGTTGNFKKGPRDAIHPAAIKKRTQRGVIATTFSQPHISRRLFIKDKSSNIAFLIDTGSDVSVLPASISEKRKGNSIQQLSTANTSINVYGKRLLTLDLNRRRVFRWPFLIASVSVPIIGADFLYHFNISPDLRNRKLIDNATKLSAICKLVSPEVHSIKLVSGESIFHGVLREFPEIVQPPSFSQEKAVSIDRVKPAYVWNDTEDIPLTGISKQQASETDQHPKDKTMSHVNKTESQSNEKIVKQTRSGRHVRFPKDLEHYITSYIDYYVRRSLKIEKEAYCGTNKIEVTINNENESVDQFEALLEQLKEKERNFNSLNELIEDILSVDTITGLQIRSLESLGVQGVSYSNLLSPILMKQISSELVLEFNRSQKDEGFDLGALLQFLNWEIRSREPAFEINKHKPCHYSPPPQNRTKNKHSYFAGRNPLRNHYQTIKNTPIYHFFHDCGESNG
ncbi:transposon Tf2-9 polyprotein [Trichonephila clavata]|uniref:Transposon Tf2-9 polyprotein n=1 Tax=Trichonephila clavata TaxID=2740835 RepID=A0A8X6I044_TRICU|nr:transposon Tf2-9 polyprotein [Trichonephila clavata]